MDKRSIYKRCIVSPMEGNRYQLKKSFRYRGIVVPLHYITNGADIPRVFWSLVPPFAPQLLPAVVLHDYLCDIEEYKTADDMFDMCLKDLEVSKWKRVVMVSAIKVYHLLVYILNTKNGNGKMIP